MAGAMSEITAGTAVVKKVAARRTAELYHYCRRQQFRWLGRANFARQKPNFTRAAGENFTSLIRVNIPPTISHLSFANLWNHLPNDILGLGQLFQNAGDQLDFDIAK